MEEKLKEAITKAQIMIEELKLPTHLQATAFQIVANYLLEVPQMKRTTDPEDVGTKNVSDQNFFGVMEQSTGIPQEHLKAIYRYDTGSLRLIAPVEGSNPDKQRIIAFLYLLGSKLGLGEDWVSADELVKPIGEYGLNDGNLSRNLKMAKEILQSGKGNMKEYGLTPNGVVVAKGLLKKIVNE